MTSNQWDVKPLPASSFNTQAENIVPSIVTKEDYDSDEGLYYISISANNIEQLRQELSRLSYYYAIPREGEFYFETRK